VHPLIPELGSTESRLSLGRRTGTADNQPDAAKLHGGGCATSAAG
jgi:hypothetical protein